MPGRNGSGPMNEGPMTGRGMGSCRSGSQGSPKKGNDNYGSGMGAGHRRGLGRGSGRGFGRRFGRGGGFGAESTGFDQTQVE